MTVLSIRNLTLRVGGRALLEGADIAFGNLETPLSDGGSPTPGKSAQSLRDHTNFIFRAPPACAAGMTGMKTSPETPQPTALFDDCAGGGVKALT